MKACFLRTARRPTGTLDAAFIFILRTFDWGSSCGSPSWNVRGSARKHTAFPSNGNTFKCIPLYVYIPLTISSITELLQHKQNLIINPADTWDRKARGNQLWCLAPSILLSTFKVSNGGHLCFPAGLYCSLICYSKQHLAFLWHFCMYEILPRATDTIQIDVDCVY